MLVLVFGPHLAVLAVLWLQMPLHRGGTWPGQHAWPLSCFLYCIVIKSPRAVPALWDGCTSNTTNPFALNSCPLLQVSDFRLASAFTATAINGPPVQGGLPVFTWRRFNHTRHQGLPESYDFHFVTMRPIL